MLLVLVPRVATAVVAVSIAVDATNTSIVAGLTSLVVEYVSNVFVDQQPHGLHKNTKQVVVPAFAQFMCQPQTNGGTVPPFEPRVRDVNLAFLLLVRAGRGHLAAAVAVLVLAVVFMVPS